MHWIIKVNKILARLPITACSLFIGRNFECINALYRISCMKYFYAVVKLPFFSDFTIGVFGVYIVDTFTRLR